MPPGAGGELESEAGDDQRLSVVLEERRGELARLGEATGGASVNIEGVCCLATGGGTATVQILVEDVTATRRALQNAGLEVSDERVELAYTTFGGVRLVLGVDDFETARAAVWPKHRESRMLDLWQIGGAR